MEEARTRLLADSRWIDARSLSNRFDTIDAIRYCASDKQRGALRCEEQKTLKCVPAPSEEEV
jgi:hypothetical protein